MARRAQEKKIVKDIGLFLLKFNLLLLPFYTIIYFDLSFISLQVGFTNLIVIVLKFLGHKPIASGYYLFVGDGGFPVEISRDCIGWKSTYSLFALVFATPGEYKNKLKFVGKWVLILIGLNTFRVISTIQFGLIFGLEHIEMIHSFFWQGGMILVVIGIWVLWLKKTKKSKRYILKM